MMPTQLNDSWPRRELRSAGVTLGNEGRRSCSQGWSSSVQTTQLRMVTVLYVEHLATIRDICKARGESNPQTLSQARQQLQRESAKALERTP